MTDLSSYLRDLAFAGAEGEILTRLLLLDAAAALEAGFGERDVLSHLASKELVAPFATRVLECLASAAADGAELAFWERA